MGWDGGVGRNNRTKLLMFVASRRKETGCAVTCTCFRAGGGPVVKHVDRLKPAKSSPKLNETEIELSLTGTPRVPFARVRWRRDMANHATAFVASVKWILSCTVFLSKCKRCTGFW